MINYYEIEKREAREYAEIKKSCMDCFAYRFDVVYMRNDRRVREHYGKASP